MIANLIKNNWKWVAIILLIVVIVVGGKLFLNEIDDNRRLRDNMEQVQTRDSKLLELKLKEFKQYYMKQDSLLIEFMKEEKLKPRHILETSNTKYIHTYDTVSVLVQNEVDTNYYDFHHRYDDCVEIIGSVNWAKKEIRHSEKLDINTTTINYWKRKHPVLWIFSRKIYYNKTINNCTGTTTTTEIKIKKQKILNL